MNVLLLSVVFGMWNVGTDGGKTKHQVAYAVHNDLADGFDWDSHFREPLMRGNELLQKRENPNDYFVQDPIIRENRPDLEFVLPTAERGWGDGDCVCCVELEAFEEPRTPFNVGMADLRYVVDGDGQYVGDGVSPVKQIGDTRLAVFYFVNTITVTRFLADGTPSEQPLLGVTSVANARGPQPDAYAIIAAQISTPQSLKVREFVLVHEFSHFMGNNREFTPTLQTRSA